MVIYIMNTDGSGLTNIPDGTQIAFDRLVSVWVINVDGSGLFDFTENQSGGNSDPSWRQ